MNQESGEFPTQPGLAAFVLIVRFPTKNVNTQFQKKQPQPPQRIEPRVFYSQSAHFNVQMRKPRAVIQDGARTLVDDRQLQFSPIGSEGFGRLITDEPEVIEFLENHPLVFGPDRYHELTTPAEMRLSMEKEESARLLTTKNELLQRIAELEANQKPA